MLDLLSARRLSELSVAARPDLDPKTEGKAHIRRVVVRMPTFIRVRDGKLDVAAEWQDERPARTEAGRPDDGDV